MTKVAHMAKRTRMKQEENPSVFIAWMKQGDKLGAAASDHWFCTLAYNGGNGPTRVYRKDWYDGRLDLGRDRAKDGPLPYFDNTTAAFAWMMANWGQQCQIHAGLAKALKVDIAEEVAAC